MALVMAVGFSLPSQVIKEPALVMQCNVTITSHKLSQKKNDWETGALQGKSDGT